MMIFDVFSMVVRISIFVPLTCPSFTEVLPIDPDAERVDISPSSSDMIFTALIGRNILSSCVLSPKAKRIVALFPIYFSHFRTVIRTGERRLFPAMRDMAVIVPERVVSSTVMLTISPGLRVSASPVSISTLI